MAVTSGTSVLGLQTLNGTENPTGTTWSLAMTGTPLPPAKRLGYFYVYTYNNVSPFQCYIIDRGPVYAPGLYRSFSVPRVASTWRYRWDVVWDVPGKTWTLAVV
jgi:hypothetical protein